MKYFVFLFGFLILIGFLGFVFAQLLPEPTPACEQGDILVDGICLVQTTDPEHYVNTSPYYQALLMMGVFVWPFFISGAAIFIVLAKTPRFKKSTRIAVTLFGSLVIVWFLIMMFIGIWPQMGD